MLTIEIPTDDPLKMVWAIRQKQYDETKQMTNEEQREYTRQKCEAFYSRMVGTPQPAEMVKDERNGQLEKNVSARLFRCGHAK
ncbi:MAG: hypothetical protein ACRC10_10695 [Thermoguttaceae bacterium]